MSQPRTHRDDMHGRRHITGASSIVTATKMRKIRHGRKNYMHRTKNGVYDPLTYWHILDALLEIVPNEAFRTTEFVRLLRDTRLQLVWDSPTVGRVMADMAETMELANGRPAIQAVRKWNGMTYSISGELEDRAALEHLLEDLGELVEKELTLELKGEFPKRTESPLLRCPISQTMAEAVSM